MPIRPQRLHLLLASALVSVCLPASAAWAETLTLTDVTGGVDGQFSITAPTVIAVDANLDEAKIRAIFAEGISGNAEDLAGLDAASITIPELKLGVDIPKTETAAASRVEFVYKDIVLSNVTDGVASSVVIGGASGNTPNEGALTMGEVAASDFSIAGMLGMYGLTGGSGDGELQTIYRDFSFGGATVSSPEFSCEIGSMQAAEFRARPFKTPFAEIMALAQELEGEAEPTPAQLGKMFAFYADMLTAYEISPVTFSGLTCKGKDDQGRMMDISLGAVAVEAFANGILPAMSIDGFKIDVENDGWMSMGNLVVKAADASGMIAALAAAPAEIDQSWLEANFRKLIPAFEGFAVSGIAMDLPDSSNPATRIKAEIADFDLTLGAYRNGIPTEIANSASGLKIPVPPEGDESKPLRDMGLTEIVADYALALKWDEAGKTIRLDGLSLSAESLGSIAIYGTIGNAGLELFGDSIEIAAMSAMGLTVKDLQVDITDAGIVDLVIAQAASEQGQTPEDFRVAMSGMAQGAILAVLGGDEGGKAVADAVGAYIGGNPELSIVVTANDANGLGIADLMAAQEDPTTLISKVKIEAFNAAAEGDATVEPAPESDATEAAPMTSGKDKANAPS